MCLLPGVFATACDRAEVDLRPFSPIPADGRAPRADVLSYPMGSYPPLSQKFLPLGDEELISRNPVL
jgi:hypothetical protein